MMQYLITVSDDTTAGDIRTALGMRLAGMFAIVPVDNVPPPPPPKHTLGHLTNQQVINLFSRAFGAAYWPVLARATNEQQLIANRSAPYTGPAIEDMPLTDEEKTALIVALGVVG